MDTNNCPICGLPSTSVTVFCHIHEGVWAKSEHRKNTDLMDDAAYETSIKQFIIDTMKEESEALASMTNTEESDNG